MGGEKWPPDRGLPPRLTEGEWRAQLAGSVRRRRPLAPGAAWTPANPGDTPGALQPGEDDPHTTYAPRMTQRLPRQVRHCSRVHASDLLWTLVPMLVMLSLFAIARFLVKIA
jgi:hypothetical protein